jgi:50S ribosomal protein L16 3-hydroxylase
VAGPGDLLYLPPGVRHDGVALEPCFTYSIGFRAPRGVELGAAFLDWLHERGLPDAEYRDPGLAPARRTGEVPRALLSFSRSYLKKIRWSSRDAARFLGEYLTEPKSHVVFRPSNSRQVLMRCAVRLDPRTRMLYRGNTFFINGASLELKGRQAVELRALADRRAAPGERLARAKLAGLLSEWQRAGYLHYERP